MSETLRAVIKQLNKLNNIGGAIERTFLTPTKEDLEANFSHKQGCLKDEPLRVEVRRIRVPPIGSGWGEIGFTVESTYMVCDSCGVGLPFVER